jgi:hypothetical protein
MALINVRLQACERREEKGIGVDVSSLAHDEAAVVDWLLERVQLPEGLNQGGVFGWFDRNPSSQFVYGEITGYYLSFLNYLQHSGVESPLLRFNATQALRWICQRWLGAPVTRAYLDGQQHRDWRNSLSFSFDEIMILRGVYAASTLVDPELRGLVLASLCQRLSAFIGEDGTLLPCLATGNTPIPERWSTRQGPYQIKAAAALMTMDSILPLKLQACARKTLSLWVTFTPEVITTEELHPLLYFVEGLLLASSVTTQFLTHAQLVLERILHSLSDETATLVRSDVIAQALRLACLVGGSQDLIRDSFATSLVNFIGADGVVYFSRDSKGQLKHANVWCGMFAAQALRYYALTLRGVPFPSDAVERLI